MLDFKRFGLSIHNVGFMLSDWLVFAIVAEEINTLIRLRRLFLHILRLGMLLCYNILCQVVSDVVFSISNVDSVWKMEGGWVGRVGVNGAHR